MVGRISPCFMGLMLLFGSGCSRTYDGTVVIPRPLDVRRFWDRPTPRVEYEQVEDGAFPVAQQPPQRLSERRVVTHAPPRRHRTRVSTAPASASEPAKLLTCRNVTEPGKRARMVCE